MNKKEITQIWRIRDENGDVTTNTTVRQRIVRGYCEKLYGRKFKSLEDMDTFLDTHILPRLNMRQQNS